MGYTGADLIKGSGNNYAHQAARAERERQARITQGTTDINSAFSQFTPDFYQQRAQTYYNYAYPQLAQQYQKTKNALGYGMANRGLYHSTAKNQGFSDASRANYQAKVGLADTGLAQAQALQQQVEAQKNTLLNQLYQSADPAGAKAGAISSAAGFSVPSVYPILANQFQGLAQQYYMNQLLNNYRQAYAAAQAPPSGEYGFGFNTQALPSVTQEGK